jgi:hypothetical protein
MGYENWELKISNYNQFNIQQKLKKLAHPTTTTTKPYPS